MQYLLLIYENEANRGNVDRSKMMEEYGTFTKSIIETGNFKAGDGLQPRPRRRPRCGSRTASR